MRYKLIMENWKKFINEGKAEIVDDVVSKIEIADEETLEKLLALVKSDGEELEEGIMGGVAVGVAGATAAMAIYDMIKMLKDDPQLVSDIVKKIEDKVDQGLNKFGKFVTDPLKNGEE